MKERPAISCRFNTDEKSLIDQMCDSVKMKPASLGRMLFLSALDYHKKYGQLPIPMAISPARTMAVFEEQETVYGSNKQMRELEFGDTDYVVRTLETLTQRLKQNSTQPVK